MRSMPLEFAHRANVKASPARSFPQESDLGRATPDHPCFSTGGGEGDEGTDVDSVFLLGLWLEYRMAHRAAHAIPKMNKHPLRLDSDEHAAKALRLLHRFTWLRPSELGRLIYPNDRHARKYAEKLVRKLLSMRMVIARKLPGRSAGTAYVVGSRGATQLDAWSDSTERHRSGKDWGMSQDGIWNPPASWRHDLMAVGVLSHLAERKNHLVVPEAQLRRINAFGIKHPDGLVVCPDKGFSLWLEVESSRKSGRNLEHLVRTVVSASRGKPLTFYKDFANNPVKLGIIAIPEICRDERGYVIDHWSRFKNKLSAMGGLKSPVSVIRCWMTCSAVGVSSIRLEHVNLSPSASSNHIIETSHQGR